MSTAGGDRFFFEEQPAGAVGPPGPPGPAGSAPTGTLGAIVAANRVVALRSAGLVTHDGTQASAETIAGGGFCVTGGASGATVTYYGSGSKVAVGATGWPTAVILWAKNDGDLTTRTAVSGTWSCPIGVYDGANLAINLGGPEFV